jgi:hypothetical protein
VKLPGARGENVTLNVAACPGINVSGAFNPEILKPDPETEACEMVALIPPIFVTATVCDWLLPVCTPLNLRLTGVAVRLAGITPLPESDMSNVVADPVTVNDNVPLLGPAAAGANRTPKVELCPGARINGSVSPE